MNDKTDALNYAKRMGATPEDLAHISLCLESLIMYARGDLQRRYMGSFVGALVDGDFVTVCATADDTNQKFLPAYASFLYNEMPSNLHRLRQRQAEVV